MKNAKPKNQLVYISEAAAIAALYVAITVAISTPSIEHKKEEDD